MLFVHCIISQQDTIPNLWISVKIYIPPTHAESQTDVRTHKYTEEVLRNNEDEIWNLFRSKAGS